MTYVSGKEIKLTNKLNPGDTSLFGDRDIGTTSGRFYFSRDGLEEWISFDGVTEITADEKYEYTNLTRELSSTEIPSTSQGTGETWLATNVGIYVAMHDQLFNKDGDNTITDGNKLYFGDDAYIGTDDNGENLNFKDGSNPKTPLSTLTSLSGADTKVAVSVDDTTTGVLNEKIVDGLNVVKNILNSGDDETLELNLNNYKDFVAGDDISKDNCVFINQTDLVGEEEANEDNISSSYANLYSLKSQEFWQELQVPSGTKKLTGVTALLKSSTLGSGSTNIVTVICRVYDDINETTELGSDTITTTLTDPAVDTEFAFNFDIDTIGMSNFFVSLEGTSVSQDNLYIRGDEDGTSLDGTAYDDDKIALSEVGIFQTKFTQLYTEGYIYKSNPSVTNRNYIDGLSNGDYDALSTANISLYGVHGTTNTITKGTKYYAGDDSLLTTTVTGLKAGKGIDDNELLINWEWTEEQEETQYAVGQVTGDYHDSTSSTQTTTRTITLGWEPKKVSVTGNIIADATEHTLGTLTKVGTSTAFSGAINISNTDNLFELYYSSGGYSTEFKVEESAGDVTGEVTINITSTGFEVVFTSQDDSTGPLSDHPVRYWNMKYEAER